MAKDKTMDPTAAFDAWMKSAAGFWGNAFPGVKSADSDDALDSVKAMQADFMAFVERRMEKDMAVVGKLTAAKSPAEIGQAQLDYLQDLLIDYNKQAMTVANASGKAMMASFSRLQKGR